LTRPNLAVLVVPLALLGLVKPLRWQQGLAVVAIIVASTVVMAPWLVRDRLTFHHWVPLTTQSGYVLAGTYNRTSASLPGDPAPWIPFTWDRHDKALLKAHPHADEAQTSSLLQADATRYLTSHPSYVVDVVYQNTRHVFDLVTPSWTRFDMSFSYGVTGTWGDADIAATWLLLPLSLAGLILPRGRRVPLAYWSAPILLWFTTVVLQGSPRFRAAIDPLLLPTAGFAVAAAWEVLRPGRRAETATAPAPSLPVR